ncbi:MAG: hypothetical protein K2X69_13515, partial [Silvanigrellaceae bacterium]|nr:hypothetical protein [Silvanigrellaceae bacterium]
IPQTSLRDYWTLVNDIYRNAPPKINIAALSPPGKAGPPNFSHFWFILFFVFIIFIQTIIFWIVSRKRPEKKWDKKFYQCIEVFEDSPLDPSLAWSLLTDPEKFMHFNSKNKVKWIKCEQPLKLGSMVKIRIRKGSIFKGFLSCFNQESRIIFEYHVWPNATRFICELEMVRLENKTRYILRMKVKNLMVPLLKKLYPRLDEKMTNTGSRILRNFLATCERMDFENHPKKSIFETSEVASSTSLENNN